MRLLPRIRRRHPEEDAAVEAAQESKRAAERARAAAGEVTNANRREYRRVHSLRVDNHLGYYLVEFARRRET